MLKKGGDVDLKSEIEIYGSSRSRNTTSDRKFRYKSRNSERSLPRASGPLVDFIFVWIALISALTSFAICAASTDLERFIYVIGIEREKGKYGGGSAKSEGDKREDKESII
jgi:hypothetical protein